MSECAKSNLYAVKATFVVQSVSSTNYLVYCTNKCHSMVPCRRTLPVDRVHGAWLAASGLHALTAASMCFSLLFSQQNSTFSCYDFLGYIFGDFLIGDTRPVCHGLKCNKIE